MVHNGAAAQARQGVSGHSVSRCDLCGPSISIIAADTILSCHSLALTKSSNFAVCLSLSKEQSRSSTYTVPGSMYAHSASLPIPSNDTTG